MSASPQGASRGDRPLWQEVWECPLAQGEPRGDRPLWQEVWRVSLQHFFLFPLPFRKGARGMVRASLETKRRAALPSPSLRAAAKQSGVEGGTPERRPPARARWPYHPDCHVASFLTMTRRGSRSAEGRSLAARGLGVSPSTFSCSPFLSGRGLGGWCVPH